VETGLGSRLAIAPTCDGKCQITDVVGRYGPKGKQVKTQYYRLDPSSDLIQTSAGYVGRTQKVGKRQWSSRGTQGHETHFKKMGTIGYT